MKTIKIFLGSSLDELYNERRLLGDYIMNSVRPIFKYDDVDVDLLKCEDMDLGFTGEPSQNIINNKLKDCNYFIFVFKKKAGDQTRLEYDIARKIQKAADHKTIIRVYILNGPEEGKEKELLDFQEQLKKDGLYWSTYNNPEDIRGKIEHHLIQFERQLLGKTKPSVVEQENETEKDGDALFADFMQDEEKRAQQKKKIHQNIEDLLQQTKTVMANEDETIAARIFKVIELYKKADQWAAATDYDKEKYSDLLFDYASFLNKYGLYKDAEAVYFRQIAVAEELYGKEDKRSATSYNEIGIVYYNKGDYDKALEYYFKALAIREKVLGMEHPDTAQTYDNIGAAYRKQGIYDEALKFMFKALEIRKKYFNIEHCDVAFSYNNIAGIFCDQGDYKNALIYQHKALDVFEKVLGTENLETATSYNNIGALLYFLNDPGNALKYHLKALKIREKVLGTEHPDTANSYNNIGLVYWKQDDYDNALKYYYKALRIREHYLDKKHPDTARTYNNIGLAYAMKGKSNKALFDKALKYYFKALKIWEKVLVKEHPDIATSYYNIGTVYCLQGNYVTALEYLNKAYPIRKYIYGSEHSETKAVQTWIDFTKEAMQSSK